MEEARLLIISVCVCAVCVCACACVCGQPLKKGECCPTYKTLCELTQRYVYVPWENHKFDSCTAKVIHNTQHTLRPPAPPPSQ
jgi:hypothetical protein